MRSIWEREERSFGWERELQREVFHGFLTEILRRLKLNRTLPEKGTLRYECNRYIVWFPILAIPLHFLLISGYLLVCLGWMMKATCCLLIYNLELMLAVVDLNVPCLRYEIPNNPSNICIWCYFSHLRRRFTDDSWCEAPFEDIFICFFYALFSLHFSLLRPLPFLDLVYYMDWEGGEEQEEAARMSRSLGIPVKLLHEAAGHVVTVEFKSGELYRGSMIECEDNWNCQLEKNHLHC